MPASAILAASVVAAWVFVALAAGQSLSAEQSSTLLMSYGAVDGTVFDTHQWWRLITSQWLHAKWQHMLLNVVGISLAGSYLERAQGWRATLGLYLAEAPLRRWQVFGPIRTWRPPALLRPCLRFTARPCCFRSQSERSDWCGGYCWRLSQFNSGWI